jgi:hypothetical protein
VTVKKKRLPLPRRYSHSGSGSGNAAMDISGLGTLISRQYQLLVYFSFLYTQGVCKFIDQKEN